MTKQKKFGWAPGLLALIIFATAVIFGLSVSGYAQTNPYVVAASVSAGSSSALPASSNAPDDPILTITKRVDEVNVLFIATDRHGKFIPNSNQTDFSISNHHSRGPAPPLATGEKLTPKRPAPKPLKCRSAPKFSSMPSLPTIAD